MKLKLKNFSYLYATITFVILLFLFSVFSTRISFHDTHEFISFTKELAGMGNVKVFLTHSPLYPFFLSLLTRFFPNILTLKLLNTLWLILIALLLLLLFKNKKAYLIFIFSPLTWHLSVLISPILPSSFFLFLAYYFFKDFQKRKNFKMLFFSGLFFGLSCAFYTASFILLIIFLLFFFFNKKFYTIFIYFFAFLIGFLPRLILDQYLFGLCVYSLIRYVGNNFVVFFKLAKQASWSFSQGLFRPSAWILFLIGITPLFFRIYKIDLKKYFKEILFVFLSSAIILVRGGIFKYFLLVSPFIALLLSTIFKKKETILTCLLSLPIILLLVFPYFEMNNDALALKDFNRIKKDFNLTKDDQIVTDSALRIASLSWDKNDPYLIWLEEYKMLKENKTYFVKYKIGSKPKVANQKNIPTKS